MAKCNFSRPVRSREIERIEIEIEKERERHTLRQTDREEGGGWGGRVLEITYAIETDDGSSVVARLPEYCFQSIPREPDEWRCHSAVLWDKQVTAVRINVVRYCLAPRNGKWFRCFWWRSLATVEEARSVARFFP